MACTPGASSGVASRIMTVMAQASGRGHGCLNGHERGAGTDPCMLTLNFPLLSALAIAWRSPCSIARVRLCSSEELSIQRHPAAREVSHLRPTCELSFRAAGPHRGLLVWEYQAAKRRRVHTSRTVWCPGVRTRLTVCRAPRGTLVMPVCS